ncbi:glycosyltransferase family 4 protein [Demequina sp. SO4-18]|uniref:glycosyltransferase family 4 protein n=1 Tax=Demequina sp. SO4-18 TaxID=3401026 RepID=UPI003B59238B
MTPVMVNGAFRAQRVTGQQRYATEIADRLVAGPGVAEARPEGRWAGSAGREWAWTLTRLPRLARHSTLVSLTSRAPLGVKQVLAVHDLFVLTHPEWYSRRYVATHAPALRAQIRAATTVIAVSEPAAQQVRDRFGVDVVVAPNAPSRVFRERGRTGDAVLGRLGISPGRYLLTVGSLDPRKNLARLAAAYERLPAPERAVMPLVVVGAGAAIYRSSDFDPPGGMTSAGYVSDDELASLYRESRAVVFPSLAEGFGLPLVEAAAAGARALVISDIPVFRWICGDGAEYVDPTSVESISRGLRAAVDGEVPAIGIDGSRFDWDASAAVVAQACELSGAAR